jgi:hypothetical protein
MLGQRPAHCVIRVTINQPQEEVPVLRVLLAAFQTSVEQLSVQNARMDNLLLHQPLHPAKIVRLEHFPRKELRYVRSAVPAILIRVSAAHPACHVDQDLIMMILLEHFVKNVLQARICHIVERLLV